MPRSSKTEILVAKLRRLRKRFERSHVQRDMEWVKTFTIDLVVDETATMQTTNECAHCGTALAPNPKETWTDRYNSYCSTPCLMSGPEGASQCAHGAFVAVGQPCAKCDLEQAQRTIAQQAAVIEELTLGFGYLPQAQAIMRKHGLLDASCTP